MDREATISLEAPDQIAERLDKRAKQIQRYLENFNKQTCESDVYRSLALSYDWTLDELEEYYEKALQKTLEILRSFPKVAPSH